MVVVGCYMALVAALVVVAPVKADASVWQSCSLKMVVVVVAARVVVVVLSCAGLGDMVVVPCTQ